MDSITTKRHCDSLAFRDDGVLALSLSSLSYRLWTGSLLCYSNPELVPSLEQVDAGIDLDTTASRVRWMSAKSSHLIAATDSGAVMLFDVDESEGSIKCLTATTHHDHVVSTLDVNADSSSAVSGSLDYTIKMWNIEDMSCRQTYRAHYSMVFCVRCHPVEPHLFISCSRDGRVLLWDTRNERPASILNTSQLPSIVTCVAWQPRQANSVALGTETGSLAVLDIRSKSLLWSPQPAHCRQVNSLAFAPHQNWLASGSEDCTATVTDLAASTPTTICRVTGHKDFVQDVAWSPTYRRLFTASWDGMVRSSTVCIGDVIASSLSSTTLNTNHMNGVGGELE